MSQAEGSKPTRTSRALIVGAAVGAAAAVLAAPRSGKETRGRMREASQAWLGRATRASGELKRGAYSQKDRLLGAGQSAQSTLDKVRRQTSKELGRTVKSVRKSAGRIARQAR